jgi:thioredoxin reductase
MAEICDVAIVGGGAAGLSAAILLGRSRRHVVLFDTGTPRNQASRAVHGLLGHEGRAPSELLATARIELERYETVTLRSDLVTAIARSGSGFSVTCEGGSSFRARKVLLTTGLIDDVPKLEGIECLYGRSVHHCPYCDGFEHRDQPLAVYGSGDKGAGLAIMMKQWSSDIVLFTDAQATVSADMAERLKQQSIEICSEQISRLEGTEDGVLKSIRLKSGRVIERSAMFFSTGSRQRSHLSELLGCARDDDGGVVTHPVTEESSVPGVYVAGDASRDVLLVAVAIGEGAKAGVAINRSLLKEDGLG